MVCAPGIGCLGFLVVLEIITWSFHIKDHRSWHDSFRPRPIIVQHLKRTNSTQYLQNTPSWTTACIPCQNVHIGRCGAGAGRVFGRYRDEGYGACGVGGNGIPSSGKPTPRWWSMISLLKNCCTHTKVWLLKDGCEGSSKQRSWEPGQYIYIYIIHICIHMGSPKPSGIFLHVPLVEVWWKMLIQGMRCGLSDGSSIVYSRLVSWNAVPFDPFLWK